MISNDDFSMRISKVVNGYIVEIFHKYRNITFAFEEEDAMLDFVEKILENVKPGSHAGGVDFKPQELFGKKKKKQSNKKMEGGNE